LITRIGPFEHSPDNNKLGVMLMSDLHLGASDTDESRIKRELEFAKANDCVVLINGDWAELIVSGDRKRYTPNVPTPDIACSAAQVDKYIDKAAAFLKPYAENIYMIGSGNHETAIQKYHGIDPTRHLIDRLGGDIVHGGYTGGVVISFQRAGAEKPSGCQKFQIWYHPGFGGSAPVTKGIIDYSRKDTDPTSGVVTFVPRAYSKRMSGQFLLANGAISGVQQILASIRATPSVYIGSEGADYGALIVYGFYRDFSIDIAYPTHSWCRIEVEGLV